MLGKHLRCDYVLCIKEMLEGDVYSLLGVFGIAINQGSFGLLFENYDDLLL